MKQAQHTAKNICGCYYWETEYYHHDNAMTMRDFVENHLPDDFEIILDDGSYSEIRNKAGSIFSLDAKGNGDCFHHVVNWRCLS